jgi:hypothetical protein
MTAGEASRIGATRVSSSAGEALENELIPAPPELRSEFLDRGDALWRKGKLDGALSAYEEGLEHCSQSHLLHKRIVGLLATSRGLESAFRYHGLERVDDRSISIRPGEIICGATVRDEDDLLPYFLDYHERLGIDRFLVVDNMSQDKTRDILLAHPKVHLWETGSRYWPANAGTAWIEVLFRAFACDHWCLVVDPDELFYYPDVETRRLPELCDDLDRSGNVAMTAVLLDMYSDRPVRDAVYRAGQDPIAVCPFFDGEFFHWRGTSGPWQNYEGFAGGLRRRVFGGDSYPFVTKVPLFRYAPDRVITGGVHSTNARPDQIATERGAVLHFKYTARFVERLEAELRERRSDAGDSSESYTTYEQAFFSDPDLCLYDPNQSVRLHDSRQLVELGVMRDAESTKKRSSEEGELPTLDDYTARMHELVPGWFDDVDAAVFRAIDEVQRSGEVMGDLLEIGAYLGKSAILLGYLLRPLERLVVCDLFTNENLDPDFDADATHYDELSRAAFEENYARFHRRPAHVIERPSTELTHEGLGRSFRIVHVDGSHSYEIVRRDVDTALEVLVDGGMVVIDDYRTVPHALGVAAAAWKAVTDGKLIPVLATVQKLYGAPPGSSDAVPRMLRRWALEEGPVPGLRQHVAGHEMVVFSPPSSPATVGLAVPDMPSPSAEDDPAILRERLALIEGSRTWRLRSALMRLVGRGRTRS